MDHSGYFPALWEHGYNGKLHMTDPTRDITHLLWQDHHKIEGPRHWTEEGLEQAMASISASRYNRKIKIADGITATFYNSGHILGGGMILLDWDGYLILYSGDVNDAQTPLFEGFESPDQKIDVLITESTNGIRDVKPRSEVNQEFHADIRRTLESGKKVIVPSFAIGRSQEILCVLSEKIADYPIYVDGMINKMNAITERYLSHDWIDKPLLDRLRREKINSPFKYDNINPITRQHVDRTGDFRRHLGNSSDPAIIVTTSGMMQPSPLHTHLAYAAGDRGNLLAVTGYQAEGTLGREILEGKRDVTLNSGWKETIDVSINAKVKRFGFSGHVSADGIKDLIKDTKPGKIFLIHGAPSSIKDLGHKLTNGFAPVSLIPQKAVQVN
ncbi:MAG: MBL fold metallo-hydrolase [Candidatus Kariarchaeaceae archaeon]